MKNLLLLIFLITGFVACKNDSKLDSSNRDIQLLTDSTAYHSNVFSDTPVTVKAEPVPMNQSQTHRVIVRTIYRNIPAKSTVSVPVNTQPAIVPPVAIPPIVATPQGTTVGNNAGKGDSLNTGTVATVPQVEKKKGWSKAAQGAAIGGVTGAIGGVILSKKKGLGAVVGGVVGAAGGYIIGKGMDKKDNRFNIE
jgi:hypothetical protein